MKSIEVYAISFDVLCVVFSKIYSNSYNPKYSFMCFIYRIDLDKL